MDTGSQKAGRAFMRLRAALWGFLPWWLQRRIHPTVIGFALLNSCTFLLDLSIVFLLGDVLAVPDSLTLVVAYTVALTAAFLLNRHFNFSAQSGHVRRQALKFLAVVAFNFAAFVFGVTLLLQTLAAAAGIAVPLVVTRLIAGLLEAVFMYICLRWFVFATSRPCGTASR